MTVLMIFLGAATMANLVCVAWNVVSAKRYQRARCGAEHMIRSCRSLHERLTSEVARRAVSSAILAGWDN